jgi:peptidoglycan/xylan/chitin deacetylase (PgdA/CDA1 family)
MSPKQEEDVLAKCVDLIEQVSGKRPRGYVAPWWEMSTVTAELLQKYGFTYDHSQGYNDFTPFYARVGDEWTKIDYTKEAGEWMKPLVRGKEIDLVEIGANWYMDDLPPMMFIKGSPNSHGFVNPRHIEEMWRDQFDWVYANMDYAVFPFTIHPDVSGRPQVLLMLERLIGYINQHEGVKWVTMEEAADDFRRRHPFGG